MLPGLQDKTIAGPAVGPGQEHLLELDPPELVGLSETRLVGRPIQDRPSCDEPGESCALGETVFHELDNDAAVPQEVLRSDLLTLRAGMTAASARHVTVVIPCTPCRNCRW